MLTFKSREYSTCVLACTVNCEWLFFNLLSQFTHVCLTQLSLFVCMCPSITGLLFWQAVIRTADLYRVAGWTDAAILVNSCPWSGLDYCSTSHQCWTGCFLHNSYLRILFFLRVCFSREWVGRMEDSPPAPLSSPLFRPHWRHPWLWYRPLTLHMWPGRSIWLVDHWRYQACLVPASLGQLWVQEGEGSIHYTTALYNIVQYSSILQYST